MWIEGLLKPSRECFRRLMTPSGRVDSRLVWLTVCVILVGACCTDAKPVIDRRVVFVFDSRQNMDVLADCPACVAYDLAKNDDLRVDVAGFVVAGHSNPPVHLIGNDMAEVFQRMAAISRRPAFVIFDTCFGASSDVLFAMGDAGISPDLIIAPPNRIPLGGLLFRGDFGELDSLEQDVASQVKCCADIPRPLTVLRPGWRPLLEDAQARAVEGAKRCESDLPFATVMPNRLAWFSGCSGESCTIDGRVLLPLNPEDWCPQRCSDYQMLGADGVTVFNVMVGEEDTDAVEFMLLAGSTHY